jgi:hypothetical protein
MLLLCVAQVTDGVRGGYPEYLETRGAAGESQVPLMDLGRPGVQDCRSAKAVEWTDQPFASAGLVAGAALLDGVFGLFCPGFGWVTRPVWGCAVFGRYWYCTVLCCSWYGCLAGLAVMDRRAYSTTMYCVYFGPLLSGACLGRGGEYPMSLSSSPSGLAACVQVLTVPVVLQDGD